MAGFWCRHGLVLFILIHTATIVENSKLNVPRVLLPLFHSFRLKYILEGTDLECYKWSTSRPEILDVQPLYEDTHRGCSSKAVVSPLSKEFDRNTAIVFAEELRSGNILRCDVIMDVIHSLNVITTTRELYIEEAPEAFEVRAYDDQGNEFSSLEGVELKWTLTTWTSQGGDVKGTNVIRFMTFNESPYETPPTVQDLDSRGLRGHIILLEGLKTGTAKVTVGLPYSEYAEVQNIVVQLNVMSNLIISPAEIYVITGDSIQYRVLQVKNGRLEEVLLLTQQYYWEVLDTNIASLDEKTSMVTALSPGKTRVVLHDRNIDESEKVARIPTANLVVSEPAYLTLTILPHRNWAVLVGENYEIIVDVFDKDDNKLHVGDVEVTTLVPAEYFLVKNISKNGTYLYGEPLAVGTAQVRATLHAVRDHQGKRRAFSPKILVQANLMIYKSIFVKPADVILPWEPVLRPRYIVELDATGGDGTYIWSSNNRSVATVTAAGVVTTYVNGHVEVYASMASNPHNKGVSKFHILPPKVIEIVDYIQETEIGKPIFLHIALFTKKQFIREKTVGGRKDSQDLVHFTQCDQVPFGVRVWDDIFVYNSSLRTVPSGVACTTLGIEAVGLGTSKVTVSYDLPSNVLTAHVTVASFKPLNILFPASGELVLAVGCSANVMFTGGPLPWVGQSTEHVRHIESGGEQSVVSVTEVNNSERQDTYIYNVLCKQLGEAEVTLTVSNKPVVKQSGHSESTASVRILCAKPRYLVLLPEVDNPTKASCPINLSPERVVVQSFNNVKLLAIVKDAHGREFYNISSLQFDWKLSDDSLASVVKPEFVQVEVDDHIPPNVHFYQYLQPHGKTGVLEVKAIVVGYHAHILRNLDIVPEYPPFAVMEEKGYDVTPDISAVLNLIFVNDAHISPNYSLLFNHPNNKLVVNVHEGSGFYELILSSEEVAVVSHQEGSKVIEIFPRAEGLLKIAIADLCLPSEPTVGEINVVSIGSIHVEAPERVEKGRCVSGLVRIYDSLENLLPIPRPDLLDLRPHIEENIISVTLQFNKDANGNIPGPGEVPFVITGLELGEKHLSFSAGHSSKEVHSESVPIQVFPPLRLLPHNITLIVGSVFQVSSRGGPLPDANIEYSISGNVASVDKTGLVEGLSVGNCVLIGRAVGLHRATGKRIVYSQDSVGIHVVPLTGITIQAPITKIINGGKMPLWANGIPDSITPLILGSSKLPVKYNWQISCRDIGKLYNVYHYAGFVTNEMDLITMHFQGLKPGRVTIGLTVLVPAQMAQASGGKEVEFSASLEIEVFEELRLLEPSTSGERQSPHIIMTPNSVTKLKTNHEGNIKYVIVEKQPRSINSSSENSSQVLSEGTPLLTVDSDGVLKSYSAHGRGVVQITVKEDFGFTQILHVTIEVKTVRYMLVSLRPQFRIKESDMISFLPRGAEIPLSISYHDNAGRAFDAFDSAIKLRMNRFDLTKIQRGSQKNIITATVLNHGITVLKLWDDLTYDHVTEFTRLKSADGILPSINVVSLGDVICFYVPFLPKQEGMAGIWTSENAAVIEVHTALGIGRARAAGTVVIKHHFSPTVYTSKEIKVQPLAKVKLLPLKEYHITNSDPGAVFRVPVVLKSADEVGNKASNLLTHEGTCPPEYTISSFPYFCSLHWTNATEFDIDDIFAVTQDFSLETGQYTCDIVASGDPPPILSTLDTNITLIVECGGLQAAPLQLRFLPGVYITTPEIHLSDAQMSGTLIVSGIAEVLSKLEIIPGNSLISVVRSADRVVESAYVYNVLLSDQYWSVGELSTRMNVSVISPLTKQVLQVPLKVHLVGEKGQIRSPCLVSHVTTWSGFFSDIVYAYRHTLLISATLLLIIIATAYGISSFTPARRENSYAAYANRRQSMFMTPSYGYGRSFGDPDMYGDGRHYNLAAQEIINRQSLGPEALRQSFAAPRTSVARRRPSAWM
ncbi:hypothetical protein R5R35_000596 [Gryllus longicercus]|uniref:BIG2 domain-containing protein n=1 Tax=Gryllus longicercus TaxID=2509291 RepID=A0AAN9Z3R2_9ORTH